MSKHKPIGDIMKGFQFVSEASLTLVVRRRTVADAFYVSPVMEVSCLLVPGCSTHWDDIRCWSRAEVGQVISVSCANASQLFNNKQGNAPVLRCVCVSYIHHFDFTSK